MEDVTGVRKKPFRRVDELALFMDQTGRLRLRLDGTSILVTCVLLSRLWVRTLPLNQPSAGRCSMFGNRIVDSPANFRSCEFQRG